VVGRAIADLVAADHPDGYRLDLSR